MANPVTNWTADPTSDPATTFATPTQGSVANCAWHYTEDAEGSRDYRIMHENIQCIIEFNAEHGIKINALDAGTTWTEDP